MHVTERCPEDGDDIFSTPDLQIFRRTALPRDHPHYADQQRIHARYQQVPAPLCGAGCPAAVPPLRDGCGTPGDRWAASCAQLDRHNSGSRAVSVADHSERSVVLLAMHNT